MPGYREKEEDRYIKKFEILVEKLPEKARAYINSKYSVYQPGTKVRYCEDLLSFFEYMADALQTDRPASELDEELGHITPQDIEQYLTYLSRYEDEQGRTRKNGPASLKRNLSAVRSFFKYMSKNGFVEKDPAALVDAPKIRDKEIVVLDNDDRQAVLTSVSDGAGLTKTELAHLKNHSVRDVAILTVLFGTGIRVSELVGLDMDDVDMTRKRMRVHRKGGKEGFVFFGAEVEDALESYLLQRRKEPVEDGDRDALFISQEHTRLSVRSVQRLVKKYGRLTQMGRDIHPHSFRKSFATAALEENDLTAVADTLGHSSTATTSKYYTKVSDRAKQNVAKTPVFKNT